MALLVIATTTIIVIVKLRSLLPTTYFLHSVLITIAVIALIVICLP